MTPEQRARFLVVHKSDSTCLAKLHAKLVEGIDADNAPRRIGSACAKAAEALAYEAEGEKTPDEMYAVAKAAIHENAVALKMSPEEIAEACATMQSAIAPNSRLRFGRPSGWESSAEFQWALDRNFKPVPPGDPRAVCGGTIDLVMWKEDEGKVKIIDDKATQSFQGHDDVQGFEGWLYALAGIEIFGVRSAWFGYRNLRAGYLVGDELRKSDPWYETVKSVVLARRAEREIAVEMDAYPETLGPDCKWCPVKHRCVEQKKAAAEGRVIPPEMEAADVARRMLAYKAMLSDYEAWCKDRIGETREPIAIGKGVVWGLKPVDSWRLVKQFDGPDGRERLVRMLKGLTQTPGQVDEALRFVDDKGLATAVKSLVHELLGREAKRFMEDASVSPIEPFTKYENSAWMPTTGKRAPAKTMEEMLDDVSW